MNRICSYDEAYNIQEADEFGWCVTCGCDPTCPMIKKYNKGKKNKGCASCDGGFGDNTEVFRMRGYRYCPYCGKELKGF